MNNEHMLHGQEATMDVTASLRKISRELLELKQDQSDLMLEDPESMKKYLNHIYSYLEGASWLIHYIADALDVELQHAAERGRRLASQSNGNVETKVTHQLNPGGQRIYGIISGEDI